MQNNIKGSENFCSKRMCLFLFNLKNPFIYIAEALSFGKHCFGNYWSCFLVCSNANIFTRLPLPGILSIERCAHCVSQNQGLVKEREPLEMNTGIYCRGLILCICGSWVDSLHKAAVFISDWGLLSNAVRRNFKRISWNSREWVGMTSQSVIASSSNDVVSWPGDADALHCGTKRTPAVWIRSWKRI